MDARGYERAVSVQIGAVLMLAILVAALSLWQVNVVPVENEDVEINHHAEVQGQLLDVRNGIVSATGGSRGFSQTVSLGTTYPQRSFLVNPPNPTGTLRTVGTTNDSIAVGIDNAIAADDDVQDAWNGTERTFGTGALVYEPNYNEFRSAPETVYENSVLYDRYETGATSERTGQRLVDGNRLSLVTLDGRYDRTARSAAIDVEAVSSSTNEVSIRNDTENVTITVPSQRSKDDWEELLREEEQWETQSGHVAGVERAGNVTADGVTYNLVEIRLEPDVTYDLEMAKVGIGSGVESESSAYLTKQTGDGATIETGEDHELVVEVRDEYNNPVSDVEVNASVTDGSGSVESGVETGTDGRAALTYNSSTETGATIEVTFSDTPGDAQTVEFTAEVIDGSSSSDPNDSGSVAYNVSWIDPSTGATESCDENSCVLNASRSETLELTMSTAPTADSAGVEYAVSNASVGAIDPSEGVTNSDGKNSTTFTADGNGTTYVYASSGSGGDRIEITVENYGVSGGQVLQPVEVRDSGDRLVFRVENAENEQVTVEQFAVDATAVGADITINNGNSEEVRISRTSTQDGEANRGGGPNQPDAFAADGTTYDLEADSNKGNSGQYAIIELEDDDVEIDVRSFSQNLGELAFADSRSEADVIVTLVLADGSEQEFYFGRV